MNTCDFKAEFCKKKDKCQKPLSRNYPNPIMGYYADKTTEFYKKSNGNFFLKTKSEAPYCYDLKAKS
jgi:hypothetical protein